VVIAFRSFVADVENNLVHVIPCGDLREHEASVECFCHPTQDDEEPRLYVHHSLDGREAFESGERLVS
jgi:hypothetical protein